MSKTKEIEITIKGKEWEEYYNKAYNKVAKTCKIDGFRPGKAPKNLILKKYERNILIDAADAASETAYMKMIKKADDVINDIVTHPSIEVKKLDNNGVTFHYTLILKPDVKLGKYKNLDVKKEKAKVTKEEVKSVIDSMLKKYAENVIKDGNVQNGDIAVIDYEGSVDNVPFEGGKGENYSLTIGSGTFIPGFEEQLIGMKKGETKDIKVTFPKEYHAEDLKGKEATFKVTVNEIKEVKIPELDADFFADLGMENVDTKESLEAKISENLLTHKENELEGKYIDTLLEEAAKSVEVEIPEVMTEEELDRMLEQYEQNLKNQGLSLEQFYKFTGSDEKVLREQMTEEANKRIKLRLMLEEIANVENIEVTEEEADKKAVEYAEKYQMEKDEFIKLFGGIEMIKYDIKMHKAVDIVKA